MEPTQILSMLPRSVKAYFFKGCSEYGEISDITRFIEISKALHCGLNLYKTVCDYIEENNIIDSVIKTSLCKMIVTLRYSQSINVDKEKNIEVAVLNDNLSLEESVNLFCNELMQRYFYVEQNGAIEYYQHFKRWEHKCHQYLHGKISKDEYILHCIHPTGWKEVCKENLINENPWRELSEQYYGYNLYDTSRTFATNEDILMLEEYNQSHKNPQYQYHLEVPAEPWQGNPLKADIIILSLNPGWDEEYNKDYAVNNIKARSAEAIFAEKRNTLLFNAQGFMPINDEVKFHFSKIGADYWKNKLQELYKEVPQKDYVGFYENFALIQYCAYTSEKYGGRFKDNQYLSTQLFTKDLIRYLVYNRPNTRFVILRAVNQWKELLDEDVWYSMLPRTIIAKYPIQQRMSKSNLGEDNFNSLVRIISGGKKSC